jgi:peptidoglycan hydrolase FlgJ
MTGAESISTHTSLPAALAVKSGSTVKDAAGTRLKGMAKEFEATFLSMLLKEMRQTLEPEGLFPGDSGDVQGGLFDLYLGRHLADSGGIGLAATIVRQMQHTAPANPVTSPHAPAAIPRDTRGIIPPTPPG